MLENNSLPAVLDTADSETTDVAVLSLTKLNDEAKTLIEQLISETDEQRTKDLTHLFNANQNKKTMVRVDKLSNLLDTITDQALARFTARPDEISNKELFDGLKIVQDLIERGQKQVSGAGETPLIQFNQQTNEVNIGDTTSTLSRDSRERVKAAVLGLLGDLASPVSASDEEVPVSVEVSDVEDINVDEESDS
jgi:hypothetical protein